MQEIFVIEFITSHSSIDSMRVGYSASIDGAKRIAEEHWGKLLAWQQCQSRVDVGFYSIYNEGLEQLTDSGLGTINWFNRTRELLG